MTPPFIKSVVCPVFIGRTSDLDSLRLLVERAKAGAGQVALLSGEAGIGKSRLVAETKAEAIAQGFIMLQGSCFPTDYAIPYAPLLDLLRAYFSASPSALNSPSVRPLVQAFAPLLPALASVQTDEVVVAHSHLDLEQEKRRRFEILAQFLASQGRGRPVLLVLEDLHWCDDTSLEFLHLLARRCAAQPLLLVLIYRSDDVQPGLRRLLAQLDREHIGHEFALHRLTRDEVGEMLRAILAIPRAVPLELVDPIYALTEGNPFFVEEVLKSRVQSGHVYYVDGEWRQKPGSELRIPRSIQDAVQQRAEHLSSDALRVLSLAAVAGRRFDFALLQRLTSYDEEHLLVLMRDLLAAQLIVEESPEQFVFRHALTRQAIYTGLLARERKLLHGKIAVLFESLSTASVDADLAYHFYEAGEWNKALRYGQRAAEQAHSLNAPHAVIEHTSRALSAAQQGGIAVPFALFQLRGQAYSILGDFDHAKSSYETALRLARAASDRHAEWQALLELGLLWATRDYNQTGRYYQEALTLARRMDDSIALAHSLNRLGNWHGNVEQPRSALQYHQEALALFRRAQNADGIAQTGDLLGMANVLGGDLWQASTTYQQAITLFEELGERQGLSSSLATLMVLGGGGSLEIDTLVPALNSYAVSLHYGEEALRIAREIGQPSAEAYALLAMAQLLGPHGEYARALHAARASLAIAERIEHRQWLVATHWLLGALTLDLLAPDVALPHLEQARFLAGEVRSLNWIRTVAGFLAPAYVLQRNTAAAEEVLTEAMESDAPMQTIGQRLVWAARADLALACGEPTMALDIADRLVASATNLASGTVIPRLWHQRGLALAALQRADEAEAALIAAHDAAQTQELPPLLWRIDASLGRLYQSLQRQADSAKAFSEARAVIAQLAGDVPERHLHDIFLTQTAALLPQQRPLTAARAAKQAYGGLTAREREVAALIGQGRSNNEIADLLHVGSRTVEAHVSGILGKLGFTSRSQIAVWVHEKGLGKK